MSAEKLFLGAEKFFSSKSGQDTLKGVAAVAAPVVAPVAVAAAPVVAAVAVGGAIGLGATWVIDKLTD